MNQRVDRIVIDKQAGRIAKSNLASREQPGEVLSAPARAGEIGGKFDQTKLFILAATPCGHKPKPFPCGVCIGSLRKSSGKH